MLVGKVRVIVENGLLSAEKAQYYIEKIEKHFKKRTLTQITFVLSDDHMDLRYSFENFPFECIRRISLQTENGRKAIVS